MIKLGLSQYEGKKKEQKPLVYDPVLHFQRMKDGFFLIL